MECYVKNDWRKMLEKISDPDKYMLVEQRITGGVIYVNKRYREASKNADTLYLDMNNLYGCAMRQYLPNSNFKWIKNIDKIEQ